MKYIGRALLCVSLIVIVFNACSNREDKKFDKVYEDETELELRNTLGKLYFKKCDDGWMYLKSKSIEEEGALLEIEKNGLLKMFRLEDE